jgi:hypothetical protein
MEGLCPLAQEEEEHGVIVWRDGRVKELQETLPFVHVQTDGESINNVYLFLLKLAFVYEVISQRLPLAISLELGDVQLEQSAFLKECSACFKTLNVDTSDPLKGGK